MIGSRVVNGGPWTPGFALLEVMVALLIMSLGILLVTRGEMRLQQVRQDVVQREQLRALAQSQLESIQACAMVHGSAPAGGLCETALAQGEHTLLLSPLRLSWRLALGRTGGMPQAQPITVAASAEAAGLRVTLQGSVLALP